MGFLGDLFGTSKYEKRIGGLSKMYGGLAQQNLPQGMDRLWQIINAQGLTPGKQAQKSIFDTDLLAGYQRTLGDTLRTNTERGMGTSLLDMGTRAAAGRSFASDKARYAGGLSGESEDEKRQMLMYMIDMFNRFGKTAIGGNQAAADVAMAPASGFGDLLTGAADVGGGIFDIWKYFNPQKT